MSNLNPRLRGLLATLALIVVMAGVPVLLLTIDAIPDLSAFSWSRLTDRDDGTLVIEVIALACWIAWAVFTCQLIASILSQIRGLRVPRWPGLAAPQRAADRLVAAAALLFVAVPAVAPVVAQPRAQATMTAPAPEVHAAVEATTSPEPAQNRAPAEEEPATESYTVRRGDSLWKIAQERLGHGTRYVELVDLNAAVLDGQPNFLRPGTVLKVPVLEATPVEGEYVVEPGDTLSEIAEQELGDAAAYPSIFEASRDTTQADGGHLRDPDLIRPGWKLTIPSRSESHTRSTPQPPRHQVAPTVVPPSHPAPIEPAAAEPMPVSSTDPEQVVPDWLLPGLAGTGSLLAGSLWLLLRQHRRTQLRYRLPGTVLAPPPEETRSAEKTIQVVGATNADRIGELDAALRSLPRRVALRWVELSDTAIVLRLAEASELPPPWTGHDDVWVIDMQAVPSAPVDSLPPYPLLVSVGEDQDGALILLNLEEHRAVAITGDSERSMALARHIAIELVVNPWASPVHVDTVGIGAEFATLNPDFLHVHETSETAFVGRLTDELRAASVCVEPDEFRAVVIAAELTPTVERLAEEIIGFGGRSGAGLAVVTTSPTPGCVTLRLTTEGRLTVPSCGLDLEPSGLSSSEAKACANLINLTREPPTTISPPGDDNSIMDSAGALTRTLTTPRPHDDVAGPQSLLPLPSQVYADCAATTVADLATLAPITASDAAASVRATDPDLDEDLARWDSPVPVAPKLTLLGPVSARTLGDAVSTSQRRPYYLEILSYLALHPNGVTADQLAEDLGIRAPKARSDLSLIRKWLGQDRSGRQFLPKAQQTHHHGEPARYALDGVLTDLDLFRRLRARGQRRGSDGISDLVTALHLVNGEPFTDLRRDGWGWLLDGDRIDHIMTASIVDVAHIVTTHALAISDLNLANFSSHVATSASPYDEVATLDRWTVDLALGNKDAAERALRERVLNRSDDDLGPIDLPPRTVEVTGRSRTSRRQAG